MPSLFLKKYPQEPPKTMTKPWVFGFIFFLCLPLHSLAQTASESNLTTQDFTIGIQRIHQINALLQKQPDHDSLHMARLRTLYFLSVEEADSLPSAWKALRGLRQRNALHADLDSAYAGAFHVLEAKHALWPPSKLDHLKKAQPLLDNAVARQPNHAEIRYMRLISTYYLPFFFGRGPTVQQDFEALAKILPEVFQDYPLPLLADMAEFVLRHAPKLTTQQKETLRTRLAKIRKTLGENA